MGVTVLMLGGSGGTGTTGIQMAKAWGATTVITTTSQANADYVTSLGADRVIDYHTQNWWDESVVANNSDTNLDNVELLDSIRDLVQAGQLHMRRITLYSLANITGAFLESSMGHVNGKIAVYIPGFSDVVV